jgi:hypothetical protein
MRTQRLVVLGLGLVQGSLAAQSATVQPASLRPDAGHGVRDSLGGGSQAYEIASAILGQTRHVSVVLPASFARSSAERRYPVTLVLDGESNLAPVAAVSAELASQGLIPEMLVVAIENEDPFAGRVHDLTPPGLNVSGSGLQAGGDRFLDFLEQELLPAVDRQFRGAAPRTLLGHSSGGMLATWAAATRPGFASVVSIDAPLRMGEDWLPKKLLARAGQPTPALRYVSCEVRFGWGDEAWQSLVSAAPAAWTLRRERLEHETHESAVLLGAYLGLREVFARSSREAAPLAPTTSFLPYYEGLSSSFAPPLLPRARLLRDVSDDLHMEGRGAAAREAHGLLVSGYGAPADEAELLAQITEVERRPPPSETVEGLLATPFPTPDEARAILGEWVGDVWMNPGEPRLAALRLRLRVVDGRVVGETLRKDAKGEAQIQTWQYLRLTPEGFTWGCMNGMRPRGLVLFEGHLAGDTLTGKQRFGGIDFRPPEGVPNMLLSFEFRRVAS